MNAWEWAEAEKAAKLAAKAGTAIVQGVERTATQVEKDIAAAHVPGEEGAISKAFHAVEHALGIGAGESATAPATAAPTQPAPAAPQEAAPAQAAPSGAEDRKAALLAELHNLEAEVGKL